MHVGVNLAAGILGSQRRIQEACSGRGVGYAGRGICGGAKPVPRKKNVFLLEVAYFSEF